MDARALTAPKMPEDALPVPLTGQETDYSCGAAALLACLRYWGVDQGLGEEELYDDLNTTEEDGTPPQMIAEEAVERGLKANYRGDVTVDDIHDGLTAGLTVILNVQADDPEGEDSGHYVVLMGMDDRNAYVMDPSGGGSYSWVPLGELERRWHDERDNGAIFIEGTQPTSTRLEEHQLERL